MDIEDPFRPLLNSNASKTVWSARKFSAQQTGEFLPTTQLPISTRAEMFAEMISSPHRSREFWEWMQSHQEPSWERNMGHALHPTEVAKKWVHRDCNTMETRNHKVWHKHSLDFVNIIVGNLANRQHYRHISIRHNFILISWRSSEQTADWVKTFLVVWPRLQHSETSVGMDQKTEVQHTCACANGGRGCRLTNYIETWWVRSGFQYSVRASDFEKLRINANGCGCNKDIMARSGATIRTGPDMFRDIVTKATMFNLSSSIVFDEKR